MSLSLAVLFWLSLSVALEYQRYATETSTHALLETHSARGLPAMGKKGVMLMNRIGPSSSKLYIANANGTNERLLLNESVFEYHASWSSDGKYITYTSERNGDGNSDIYRVKVDGSGMEMILGTPSFEDCVAINPDGTLAAYVSTANGFKANIWVMDLTSKASWNLTNTTITAGNASLPGGHFRPSWSHDGQWIVFSSDRNTQWRGHDNGTGWEHTQELSIYTIRPDGSDFRQVSTRAGYSLGSPKFSLDDTRIVYHEMTRQSTWDAHRPEDANTVMSQIVSVNFITGLDRIEETSGPGLKMHPQYISNNNIAYLVKFGSNAGLNYTKPDSDHVQSLATVRSPSWSPDGLSVVYEKPDFTVRALEKPLYSWDNDWEYRFTDVFPEISKTGILAMTAKQTGNATSNIVTLNPDGSNLQVIFNVLDKLNLTEVRKGLSGAFQPAWSPDSQWIAFGLGAWFQQRAQETASIYQVTANGSYSEQLTDGSVNSGFPSYSLDGRYIVYRVWGAEFGLRIMDLTDKSIKVLTNDSVFFDNLPHFSPDGTTIVFTRRTEVGQVDDPDRTNYDICTIKPDGTGFRRLTDSGANDAHAVWTEDGRILYNSGMYGFRDECAIYDNTFQPYGQIMIMNADGSNKTMLTDSMWEDSMPIFLPNSILI